jgi:hypothetical protein
VSPPRQDDVVRIDRGPLGGAGGGERATGGAAAALAGVFFGLLLRGLGRKALLALALLPAVGLGIWIAVRARISQVAVPADQAVAFALETLTLGMRAAAAWALFAAAVVVAREVPADLRAGALLLYFTRPIERLDYALGRLLASAAWLALGVGAPLLLEVLALAWGFGLRPEGHGAPSGWLLWPGLALAVAIAAAVVGGCLAAVALGVSALVRAPAGAALALIGGVLGSSVVAGVAVALAGRERLLGALDLLAGLGAPLALAVRPLDPAAPLALARAEAWLGLGCWLALGALGWFGLLRAVREAPLGRGRA